MLLTSPTTSRICSPPSSPPWVLIPTPNTTCLACRRFTVWKTRRTRSGNCWPERMKLTLDLDAKLPTGALGLAVAPDESAAYAACANGAIYSVDLDTGDADAFDEKHTSFA